PSPGFQSRFFVLANENRTQDAGHALLRQGRNPKVRKNSGVIDESYVADVQTAKYLFDPAEYLNMVASYVSDNELQHKTGERREQQLCHAAYTFALKGNGVTNQNGKVRITADQANDVLEGWRLKDSGSEFLELLVKD
ncbi:hypothetical protein ACR73S_08165, partial [Bifidobacterium adolescentis]|uniref:hypothetical protein n=1 Tax=Bifidobacterium adolescentis TaxID=1680 RepID=UPI003DA67929